MRDVNNGKNYYCTKEQNIDNVLHYACINTGGNGSNYSPFGSSEPIYKADNFNQLNPYLEPGNPPDGSIEEAYKRIITTKSRLT